MWTRLPQSHVVQKLTPPPPSPKHWDTLAEMQASPRRLLVRVKLGGPTETDNSRISLQASCVNTSRCNINSISHRKSPSGMAGRGQTELQRRHLEGKMPQIGSWMVGCFWWSLHCKCNRWKDTVVIPAVSLYVVFFSPPVIMLRHNFLGLTLNQDVILGLFSSSPQSATAPHPFHPKVSNQFFGTSAVLTLTALKLQMEELRWAMTNRLPPV